MGADAIDPATALPLEPGLVWTCWRRADGSVALDDGPPPEDCGFRWLHLDLWDQRSARWIARRAGLPDEIAALFLDGDDRPRGLVRDGALALVLPDFEREFERVDTGRIGALHLALKPGLMLTGRHRPLHTPDVIRHRAAGAAAIDGEAALELVLSSICDTLATRTRAALTDLLAAEDQLLADETMPDTRALVALRRITARLHRMAGSMRVALGRMEDDPGLPPPLAPILERVLRRLQGIERDVVGAQGQLRMLREELDLQAAQRTNENVYLLSVVTALLMPATLVTGFFGMNTGALPFTGAGGTALATLIAIGASAGSWFLLRSIGLFRR